MKLLTIFITIFLTATSFTSCIKQVDVATRNEKPVLVVEGSVTTDTIPYVVRLTYSGPITSSENIPDNFLEKDATVSISDDLGHTTPLVYTSDGNYETSDPSYIGTVGRSYSIAVVLKDGKKYISTPEKIKAPVPVAAVKATYVSNFDFNLPTYMNVSVDVDDPVGEENYYRWTFYSWTGRQTRGVSCGIGCVMFEYCYQKSIDKDIHILSDAAVNGNRIRNQTVGRCYIYTYLNDFIDIAQNSLSREAFQFWKRYDEQLTRTGGILDPLPAAIRGNVFNAANGSDFALGYFSASSVVHKKAVLIPNSITPYLLQISAQQFIPPDNVACFDYFPNTLSYTPARQYPPPPGWDDAEQINVFW